MILKSYEVQKINFSEKKFLLFYGENEGNKEEAIHNIIKSKKEFSKYNYEENEIINNLNNFFNLIISKSFFDNEKIIIISRATEKIHAIIEEIIERNIMDIIVIINTGILEKRSKLRNFFEKSDKTICIPFYADTKQTLAKLSKQFIDANKIKISQNNINLIIERSMGSRKNLYNELLKIKNFTVKKGRINDDEVLRLTNLNENYNISELVDNCLLKNKKKTVFILNENNFLSEDCILITRIFSQKLKRLLKIQNELKSSKNIDNVISSYKPPIFWKDKDVIKIQIQKWPDYNIKKILYKINDIEFLIKKNSYNGLNIISDFIIEQSEVINN